MKGSLWKTCTRYSFARFTYFQKFSLLSALWVHSTSFYSQLSSNIKWHMSWTVSHTYLWFIQLHFFSTLPICSDTCCEQWVRLTCGSFNFIFSNPSNMKWHMLWTMSQTDLWFIPLHFVPNSLPIYSDTCCEQWVRLTCASFNFHFVPNSLPTWSDTLWTVSQTDLGFIPLHFVSNSPPT